MTHPGRPAADIPEPSVVPLRGWHAGHYFYRWDRPRLRKIVRERVEVERVMQEFEEALSPEGSLRPERLQSFIVSGHKADVALVMMDPDPLKIDAVHQRLMATRLGMALQPTYSFVSMSEISEYLPSLDQYREKLLRGGEVADSPTFLAKVQGYEKRLPMMEAQRLAPEFPNWPAMCFYPMNKSRSVGANWFQEPFSARAEMMAEHAQSGMTFGGRVTQLVTVSVGLDDWEWGVTLWAKNPQYLKDIVYAMRFDEASARFGQFGQFYTGYLADPRTILEHCAIAKSLIDTIEAGP